VGRPLVDSWALAFGRRADVSDAVGEDQRISGCIGWTSVGHPHGHQRTCQHVPLRSDQDRVATLVGRIEGVERLRQRREAVPRREGRILAVVQRRHGDTHSQIVRGDELDDEDVFRRLVVVGAEILGEGVGQRVMAGIQNAVYRSDGGYARTLASAYGYTLTR